MNDVRPPYDVRVGDIMTAEYGNRRNGSLREAEIVVTRVARLWVYGHEVNDKYERIVQFSKADGHIYGGNYNSPGRVSTKVQLEFDRRHHAAMGWISENVTAPFNLKSSWRGRELELANLLRRHDGLEEL